MVERSSTTPPPADAGDTATGHGGFWQPAVRHPWLTALAVLATGIVVLIV